LLLGNVHDFFFKSVGILSTTASKAENGPCFRNKKHGKFCIVVSYCIL